MSFDGMLTTYVKKPFDSVHRKALWDLLRLRGIPAGIIGLLTGLYDFYDLYRVHKFDN